MIVIRAGLALTLASMGLYACGTRASRFARWAFVAAAACVLLASIALQTLLQQHRFDINYVYRYSARELNPFYLFATFWAGQEGSFLLWAFWISVLGVALVFKSSAAMQRRVMPVYGAILAFLMIILTIKSPFALYRGPVESDGMGLQPLLENPWMVIHPPTLFLGFAATAVPFAYGIAALIFGDDGWYRRIWPWALFCFGVLGFGIMLGGYWAYETLGWGGFWGWDPVENGPLIPWLLMGGFIHAVQAQQARGALKRSTYLFGALPFLGTLYETFLTRTGILTNFSNHSFSTLGGRANSVILWFMLASTAVSILLLWIRGRKIVDENGVWDQPSSREFGLTMAIIIMAACALITGIGMSAPLLTQLGVKLGWTAHQSSVQPDYYNKANFPAALLLAVGMAVGPYLGWKATGAERLSRLQWPWAIAVLLTIGIFAAGRTYLGARFTCPEILLLALSLFALFANGALLLRLFRGRERSALTFGGAVSHAGAAILLLGIACLVGLQKAEDVDLVTNHPAMMQSMPYTITFLGMSKTLRDRDNVLRFRVERNMGDGAVAGLNFDPHSPAARLAVFAGKPGDSFPISLPLAIRKQERTPVLLGRPAIQHHWWGDLYFALKAGPEQVSPSQLIRFTLAKGHSTTVAGYTYTFEAFQVPPDVGALVERGMMPARFPVVAVVDVRDPRGRVTRLYPANIRDRDDPMGPSTPEYRLPRPARGTWWGITFEAMNADSETASLFVRDLSMAPLTRYTIQVSTRPLIWMVWLGTLLLTAGALIAARRRALEARLAPVPDPSAGRIPGLPSADRRSSPHSTRRAPAVVR